MLGGMTREVFESMFSITHESLVVGGNALLAADGDLGESLFSASLGATGLHELRAALDLQASGLFRPRASSSLVLLARAALEAAQSEQREKHATRNEIFTEHVARHPRAPRRARTARRADPRRAHRKQTSGHACAWSSRCSPRTADLRRACAARLTPGSAATTLRATLRATERAASERNTAEDARARVADLQPSA